MPHDHRHARALPPAERQLVAVFLLTLVYTGCEIAGGIASGSLALLADAGHMATDDLALGLAVFAAWAARRPPDPGRTYGYQRVEILAALANGILLVLICGWVVWEAIRRLAAPPEVASGLMAAVALGGLAVNAAGAYLLHDHREGMNSRAAFLHVVGDLLGSIGTLVAAGLVALFGWRYADPAASLFIAALLAIGSGRLVWESIHVLLEGAPAHLDAEEIGRALGALAGVVDVHDLHLWSLGGRVPLLSAHVVVEHDARPHEILRAARRTLREDFGIDHVTIQIEPPDYNIHGLERVAVDGGPESR